MMHFCAESIIHLFWSAGEEESEKKDDEDKKEEKEDEEKSPEESKTAKGGSLLESLRNVASQVPSMFKGSKKSTKTENEVDLEAGEKEELLEPGKEGEEDIKKDENELGKLRFKSWRQKKARQISEMNSIPLTLL